MKKKILSLLLCVFVGVSCLFSFAGCGALKDDTEKINSKAVLKIGDKEYTRGDVSSAFYTYYQNNSNYFAYYDNDTIKNSFYQWFIVRQLVNDYAELALYSESNKNGFMGHVTYYTKADAEDVWNSVLEYFYSEVSKKEKVLYATNSKFGEDTEKYPIWLRDAEDEEEPSVFEPFKSSVSQIEDRDKTNLASKLTEGEVNAMVDQVVKFIYEYVPDKNDLDEKDNPVRVSMDETNYITGARKSAFINYKADLVSSAKNKGNSTDMEVVFKAEVFRIYEAYYQSRISTLFQDYFLKEYLIDTNNGDKVSLGDAAIVKAFVTQYFSDKQNYSSEQTYISTMQPEQTSNSSEKKITPLALYYFNGKYYYFTVQHILLKFSDYISDQVKALDEYSQNDQYTEISDVYKAKRNNLAEIYSNAMLAEVSDKNGFDTVALLGNYYYYDKELKDLYGKYTYNEAAGEYEEDASGDVEIYGGYIKLSNFDSSSFDYTSANLSEIDYNKNSLYEKYSDEEVVLMATKEEVLDCYDLTFKYWKGLVDNYLSADEEARKTIVGAHKDMEYVFEVALNMNEAGKTTNEIYSKVASFLFIELEWVYSADSLGNEYTNKAGYLVTNAKGENGNLVSDFTIGSRKLLESLDETKINNAITTGDVSELTYSAVSDYGIHILKVEDIYECGGSPVDIEAVIANYDGKVDYNNKEFVSEVATLLKTTYVANGSNETLYDYFYEILYTNYVGSSSSSGTYFLAIEYEWLANLYAEDKIVFINELSYDDLMDTLK